MKPIDDDPLLQAIVIAADRSPIGLHLVVSIVRLVGKRLHDEAPRDLRAPVLAILREALRRRALVVGSLDGQDFEAWHLSPDEAIARIDAEWIALGREPRSGEIASFATIDALGYA